MKLLKALSNPHGAIIDAVVKIILKRFKLDKILSYVEEPNELDEGLKAMKEEVESIKKDMAGLKEVIQADPEKIL